MMRTVAEKMGIHADSSVLIPNAPDTSVVDAINLPSVHRSHAAESESFDHVIWFVVTQLDMDEAFDTQKLQINPAGKLWLAWPKAGKLGTDLNIKHVIRIGYDHGLVESTNLRIDDTWTALKFTHPKPGKTYNNSYGSLK